jgi:LPXTG-motif cell wall-anchored protein
MPTEAPAATEEPQAPATLPETAESSNLPTGALALGALALVGLGALVLLRRRSTN